ncbi:hypothetical protein [Rufibacter ruber]|uniref:hypothetical protein n=1 Tax=Rufibacter ruber TaxID=1783499 RepID=UPI00128FDA18|nr:hypothetical protein [Rufibacter ruber]
MEADKVTDYAFVDNQVDALTMTGNFGMWDRLEALAFSVKSETSKAGTVYSVEVSFRVPALKTDTGRQIKELVKNDTTAIIEDRNGRFWLLGYKQGLSASYDAGTEDGAYNVKLVTKQLNEVEEVSYRLMTTLTLNPELDSTTPQPSYSNPPIGHTPDTGGNTGGGNSSSRNVYKVVTVVANNSQVTNDLHFIKVPEPYTVLLPIAPVEGQSHYFKATFDASISPVILESGSYLIDGESDFQINSDLGSVQLVFQGGAWSVIA